MKPILQALLIADHVYTDQETGKKIVAGIFHTLWFKTIKAELTTEGDEALVTIPMIPGGYKAGSPFCYISLTEVRGEQNFELRYVDLNNDTPLFKADIKVVSRGPLETVEIVLPVPQLPAKKAGTFALELLWKNEPLGTHRIKVDEIKEEGESDGS